MRKCCVESDGKRSKEQHLAESNMRMRLLCSSSSAPFMRRGWKAYYASLRDMILYLHKNDEHPAAIVIGDTNAIRLHHALAQVAVDYRKRQHVFRLKTSDWAEYLFQTSDQDLLNKWIEAINLIAASFSSPPLPAAIDSVSLRFQRPLLPSVQTRHSVVRLVERAPLPFTSRRSISSSSSVRTIRLSSLPNQRDHETVGRATCSVLCTYDYQRRHQTDESM